MIEVLVFQKDNGSYMALAINADFSFTSSSLKEVQEMIDSLDGKPIVSFKPRVDLQAAFNSYKEKGHSFILEISDLSLKVIDALQIRSSCYCW